MRLILAFEWLKTSQDDFMKSLKVVNLYIFIVYNILVK